MNATLPSPMDYEEWSNRQNKTHLTVDSHELQVAYFEQGQGDPVVFLHGIPTWSYLWRHILPPFSERWRVVAPDLIGYGNSSQFDGFDRSIRAQEVMLSRLLDQVGIERVTLVAHDIGGGVALRYAWHHPVSVENLVLSNSVAFDSWPIERITDLGLRATINNMSVQDVIEALRGLMQQTLVAESPDPHFIEAMSSRWASEQGRVSLSRNAVATNTNHTTEIEYGEITARTLLLWGTRDEFQPVQYARRLEEQLPRVEELVELLQASHWVPEDQPEPFLSHLERFLPA